MLQQSKCVETHTFWFGFWHFQKRIYFTEFKFNSNSYKEDSEETRREKNMYIQIAIAEINKVDIYLIDFWLQLLFKNYLMLYNGFKQWQCSGASVSVILGATSK